MFYIFVSLISYQINNRTSPNTSGNCEFCESKHCVQSIITPILNGIILLFIYWKSKKMGRLLIIIVFIGNINQTLHLFMKYFKIERKKNHANKQATKDAMLCRESSEESADFLIWKSRWTLPSLFAEHNSAPFTLPSRWRKDFAAQQQGKSVHTQCHECRLWLMKAIDFSWV